LQCQSGAEVTVRFEQLTIEQAVIRFINMKVDLYHHLRSGHDRTEDEAVRAVLEDLAYFLTGVRASHPPT
jgi:hypothetical protein